MDPLSWFSSLPLVLRVAGIVGVAALAQLAVRGLRALGEWVLARQRGPGATPRDLLARHHPRVASLTSLAVSGLTFLIYFMAVGLVLHEFHVSLTAYLATASVVGLAVGFGLQGLVQDVVIGITLIFSDAFNVGDVVEISGQVGRVEAVGLRFTTLINLHGQRVFVPNRSIGTVARFRRGTIRAYVDVQIPAGADEAAVRAAVERVALGMRAQHHAVLVADPEVIGLAEAGPGGWRYVRVKLRLWPGQGALLDTTLRQRLLAALREFDPACQEWMITIAYRA
jgi:small conductance mechanosensitive channel